MYKPEYQEKYVKLAVEVGAAVQKGQKLLIRSQVESAYFARMAMEAAYKAGAKEVIVQWIDDACSRLTYLNADETVFDTYPVWSKHLQNDLSAEGCAFLSISGSDPEALKGVDFSRVVRFNKSAEDAIKPFRDRTMSNEIQWSVVAIPTAAWAKKVFPDELSVDDSIRKLWDAIFAASRIDENDPVENWKEHTARIHKNVKILNDYNFKFLKYTSSNGTDLQIELPENHIWAGGGDISKSGQEFLPNIPTEEIFTAPKFDAVNGIVYGTKPLVYSGNVIEDFSVTFENGKVVKFSAKKNEDVLAKILSSTENMDFLGEVALVPFHSPISDMNILFYNTLYDENASCHLAFGRAYPDCIKDGAKLSDEEKKKAGLNLCADHHDFMVGSRDMKIVGTTHDGREVVVFEDGDFAF